VFPGFLLNFTKEKDQLKVQATGLPKMTVFPASPTRFFAKDIDAQYTFLKPSNGQVTTVMVEEDPRGVRGIPARRVKTVSLTPEQRAAYVGDFYSDELRVVYRIDCRDGQLVLRHPRGEVTLIPCGDDEFRSDFATLHFARDHGKQVRALLVNATHVRALCFSKAVQGLWLLGTWPRQIETARINHAQDCLEYQKTQLTEIQ
jgi:hypothetical protein